jgi:D-alanyl-D-alanine dipeptidase
MRFVFLLLFWGVSGLRAGELLPSEQNWVELAPLKAGFVLDLRYGSTNNFTGEILYPVPKAYLRRAPALALVEVQKDLQKMGLGLKIFDAYRPLPVQQKMWDLIKDERYVSNPAVNAGRHTRGTAVDVTLVFLKDGKELPMPTGYDDFSEKAHSEYPGATPEQKKSRDILRHAMEKHGFSVYPTEWWHFDFKGWEQYPPSAITIEKIQPSSS